MLKRRSLVAAGLLAGATMLVTASPAQAQNCQSAGDPVLGYVCTIVNNAPEPGPTIDHYYYTAFNTIHVVYCTVSPSC